MKFGSTYAQKTIADTAFSESKIIYDSVNGNENLFEVTGVTNTAGVEVGTDAKSLR